MENTHHSKKASSNYEQYSHRPRIIHSSISTCWYFYFTWIRKGDQYVEHIGIPEHITTPPDVARVSRYLWRDCPRSPHVARNCSPSCGYGNDCDTGWYHIFLSRGEGFFGHERRLGVSIHITEYSIYPHAHWRWVLDHTGTPILSSKHSFRLLKCVVDSGTYPQLRRFTLESLRHLEWKWRCALSHHQPMH